MCTPLRDAFQRLAVLFESGRNSEKCFITSRWDRTLDLECLFDLFEVDVGGLLLRIKNPACKEASVQVRVLGQLVAQRRTCILDACFPDVRSSFRSDSPLGIDAVVQEGGL